MARTRNLRKKSKMENSHRRSKIKKEKNTKKRRFLVRGCPTCSTRRQKYLLVHQLGVSAQPAALGSEEARLVLRGEPREQVEEAHRGVEVEDRQLGERALEERPPSVPCNVPKNVRASVKT